MKLLLSPAKSLDFTSKLPEITATQPLFLKDSIQNSESTEREIATAARKFDAYKHQIVRA